MMNFSGVHLTTTAVWQITLVIAMVDTACIGGIWKFVPICWYLKLSRWAAVISLLFFAALWSFVLHWGWDWFYSYLFPGWMRHTSLGWGLTYGAIGAGMWRLSLHLPGRPAANFCLLGGVEGLLSHLWAIYGVGAVSMPPLMQGVDPFAVLIFAVFEKAFYWTLVLLLALGAQRSFKILRGWVRRKTLNRSTTTSSIHDS